MNHQDLKSPYLSRRSMIKGAAIGAAGAFGLKASAHEANTARAQLKKGAVIVFQGDSITDEGRKKEEENSVANNTRGLGRGYAAMAAGLILANHPDKALNIYNRGISGNKVPDLDARWQKDVIDLKPDIVSIMVGVNDYWHTIAFGSKYKGTVQDYEEGYRALIQRTQKELPKTRIVICDPFTYRKWPDYVPYPKIAAKLAKAFNLTFVPFGERFEPIRNAPSPQFWLWDGVHPTAPGHALMAQTWCDAVGI